MNELYAETAVKRKAKASDIVLKVFLVIGIVVLFVLSILLAGQFGRILTFVSVLAVVGLIWYWPRFQIEWEYVFCDGQLDFDMIMGGDKRKQALRIEIEEADVIAPLDSSRMDGYRHLRVKDYSSLQSDTKKYAIVTKLKGEKIVLVFEPSEKMLDMMSTKAPNIVEV